jgi:prepilin-type N-terminal cleavage/methylation domain-containing protein/prepilin-type processing-associated H-X9-DG protein
MKKQIPPGSKEHGFTLIEILVVVAIIALLAAILFPVFSRARENARRASCQSNMKQLGLAITQYVQDYDERYPIGQIVPSADTADRPCVSNTAIAYGPKVRSLTVGSGATDYGLFWMSVITSYTKSQQIYRCPSGPNLADGTNWNTTTQNGYGILAYAHNPMVLLNSVWQKGSAAPFNSPTIDANCEVVSPWGWRTMHAASFGSPASVVMLSDRGRTDREAMSCVYSQQPSTSPYYPCSSATGWASGSDTPDAAKGTNPADRHFEGSNFLFIDGHVKWLSFTDYKARKGTSSTPGLLNIDIANRSADG